MKITRRVLSAAALVAILGWGASISGCSIFGVSKFDVLSALSTVRSGIAAAVNGVASNPNGNVATPAGTGSAITYTYTAANGAVVFSFVYSYTPPSTAAYIADGGSVVFASYRSPNSPYAVSGTLAVGVTPGGANTAVSLDGNLQLTGGTITSLECQLTAEGDQNSLNTSGVALSSYSGSLIADGQSFNVDGLY